MKTISLLKQWKLVEKPLQVTAADAQKVLDCREGWMDIKSLPCDVHMPLVEYGKIADPLVANNSFDCQWIEDRSWWFKKQFTLAADEIGKFGTELFIEMLDIHADIFLNGSFIGHHASAMYPFCKNVNPWLRAGENTLLIRLTTGLEQVTDEDIAPVRDYVSCEWRRRREGRGEERRVMLRKPQYVFGWDQSPRLATCAIAGDVCLRCLDEVVVRDIRFETISLGENSASILAEVEVESRELTFARECTVTFTVEKDGKTVHTATQTYISQCGINYRDFSFTMQNPALWWPNGYGEQPLYTVRAKVTNNNGAADEKTIETGIRTVKLDTSPVNAEERRYAFFVNGKRIYCRGADFIMSDHIYANITTALQDKLLTAAKNAHFCMVRFWDGNVYQTDDVYALCDRYGILVIQNFCFACAAYPDHLESFCNEVEKEAVYQLRRLRSHPSLAMWYGNGENSSILTNYLNLHYFEEYDSAIYTGGTYLYNTLLPQLHHALNPSVEYQCTTPFGGFDTSESELRGDRHYYPFLDLRPENQQFRISTDSFDVLKCKFITESGVMGPPSAQALLRYCGGRENITPDSPVFEHHRNTFERNAVRDGIWKHYTGQKELTVEEYCLYGGLFQGTMLAYASDHVRVLPEFSGSVLWCFNDGFGEVGFSIMDHYGDPKPAYYFLKRAYAPRRLVLKKQDDRVLVYCTNSSAVAFDGKINCGYTTFDGKTVQAEDVCVSLPAYAPATLIATLPLDKHDLRRGVFFAQGDGLDTATLHASDFSALELPQKAVITVSDMKKTDGKLTFAVTSDVFAHAVHFGMPAENVFSDLYFDLLPGEKKEITLHNPDDISFEDIQADSVFITDK